MKLHGIVHILPDTKDKVSRAELLDTIRKDKMDGYVDEAKAKKYIADKPFKLVPAECF